MTTVSVIIPNYNQSHFLGAAIRSVLIQMYQAHEIIVVDDGSDDDSREVVDQFGGKIRYIRQENQGLAGARNTGIQASAGELIGLLDADDEWMPDYLQVMARLADENPDVPVFYCMARCMDTAGNDLPQVVGGPPRDPNVLYHQLLRQNFIIPSTVLFRKDPVVESGSFDATLRSCEDWDLWLRLLPTRKLVGSPRSLVRYRVHDSSLSTNVQRMQDAAKQVVQKHFGPEEADVSSWSAEKRRAYGGLYRYQALTFVQRQNNWGAAETSMYKALQIDPSLADDLGFFYELALGSQPVGYRGTGELGEIDRNAVSLDQLIRRVCHREEIKSLSRRVMGTCRYAAGLVFYNHGDRSRSRDYFVQAIINRPGLIFDARLIGDFIKSFLSRRSIALLRRFPGFPR